MCLYTVKTKQRNNNNNNKNKTKQKNRYSLHDLPSKTKK